MQLVTEKSAWWIIVCLLGGITYAFLLYRRTTVFPLPLRRMLFFFRAFTVSILAFLLLSPLIRTFSREKEKPLLIIAADNSESILQSDSAIALHKLPEAYDKMKHAVQDKYDVHVITFSDRVDEGRPIDYTGQQTDFSGLFHELNARYSNRNIGAVIIASDGLYNKGGNPVYEPLDFKAPIHTIAVGDTVVRKDLILSGINFNKVVYLGNAFPLEISVDARQCSGSNFSLTVTQDSQTVFTRSLTATGNRYRLKIPVTLDAKKKGLMRLHVALSELPDEVSLDNNARDIFIEVKESKEKILVLANAPHPDLGAFKTMLEGSQNYQVDVRIIDDNPVSIGDNNLVIFHNLPSSRNSLENLFGQLRSSGVPSLFVLGSQTNLAALNRLNAGLTVNTSVTGKSNPVSAAFNASFSLFTLDDLVKERSVSFPPLSAPFGEYRTSGTPSVLFYQQIGSVRSGEPMLLFTQNDRLRSGFLCGEGYWRWPVSEFAQYGEQMVSRELLVKSVQYLSVKDGRSKFRILLKNSFNENEPVLIDAEVFNDNYELINTPDVNLDITDSQGKKYPFLFSKSERSYSLNAGYLPPGKYTYAANSKVGEAKYTSSGSFFVAEIRAEQTETVADHAMLSALSSANDGSMYDLSTIDQLTGRLLEDDRSKIVSYAQVKLQDLINLKLVFGLILLLLSAEWLLRKRAGSY